MEATSSVAFFMIMPKNIECKAKHDNLSKIEDILVSLNARYVGLDHQIDTYFNVHHGRLKLREGTIENALIHYERENVATAKLSNVILYQHQPDTQLKAALTKALGVKTVVDKQRKIYYVDNVKIHLDEVLHLGTFIEIEAIDSTDQIAIETLQKQCDQFIQLFNIQPADFCSESYSDMLYEKNL
jgi:adenylate cyclase, class 2